MERADQSVRELHTKSRKMTNLHRIHSLRLHHHRPPPPHKMTPFQYTFTVNSNAHGQLGVGVSPKTSNCTPISSRAVLARPSRSFRQVTYILRNYATIRQTRLFARRIQHFLNHIRLQHRQYNQLCSHGDRINQFDTVIKPSTLIIFTAQNYPPLVLLWNHHRHKIPPSNHKVTGNNSRTPKLECMQLAQNGYTSIRIPISPRAALVQF